MSKLLPPYFTRKRGGEVPTEIDSLQIEIKAKSQSASEAIDKLVSRLDRLTSGLKSVDGTSLSSLSSGVDRLGKAMQTMSGVKTADFTRLGKNLSALNNIDVSNLYDVAASAKNISSAFSGFENLGTASKQISELANGIKQLGYKSADKAISNIPKLATSMRELMSELSKAPKVSQNLIDMTNALAKLARTGASSGKAATALEKSLGSMSSKLFKNSKIAGIFGKSMSGASLGVGKLKNNIVSLLGSLGGMYAAFNGIKESINLSSDLSEVQNVIEVTFGKYQALIDKFTQTSIPDYGISELTAKQIASRFQAMGTAMGIAKGKMADMSVELTALTADMASFYNVSQEDMGKSLQSIFTGETEPLRKYGISLDLATVSEWAMKQGIDANINSMTMLEKTMLRYQYVLANSSAAQGDFARTSGSWANSIRVLKEQLKEIASIIGGAFINALKPFVNALNTALSAVKTFVENVVNALGAIFGWKMEISGGGIESDFEGAADAAGDLASGTGKAAKNVEKMKKGLREFDELKVIDIQNNASGSGSGGGGGVSSSGSSEQNSDIETKLEKTESMFSSFIGNLEELGSHISGTILSNLRAINWEEVYAAASSFGTGLAQFLNGLITPGLFSELGKTVANSLNTSLKTLNSFGETFEWTEFGTSIGEGINGFFENFSFVELAETINTWVQGTWETLTTAIDTIEWEKVWDGVKDLVGNIDLETVDILVFAFALKWSGKLISSAIVNSVISAKLQALKVAGSLTIPSIGLLIKNFVFSSGSGGAFTKFASDLFAQIDIALTDAAEGTWAEGVLEAIGNALLGASTGGIIGSAIPGIGTVAGAIVGAITGAIGGIEINGQAILSHIAEKIFNFDTSFYLFSDAAKRFKEAFSGEMVKEDGTIDYLGIAGNIILGLGEGILGALGLIVEPIVDLFNFVGEKICEVFGIHSPAKNMEPFGENILLGLVEGFSSSVSEFSKAISDWWKNNVEPWFKKDKWSNLGNNAKTAIIKKFNEMVSDWNKKVSDWFSSIKTNFSTENWKKRIGSIKTAISSKWQETISYWKSKTDLSKVKFTFMDLTAKVKEAWKKLRDWWNNNRPNLSEITAKIKLPHLKVSWDTSGFAAEALQKLGLKGFPNFSVSYYAAGGFPDKSSLFFAGENGIPELLGTVGGKTAVAGGAEITGIRQEIRNTANEEIALLRQQNALLQALLEKDYGITTNEIGAAAQKYSREYYRRTGKPAYSI